MIDWRPVVGWEGIYEVSNEGQVKRLERTDTLGRTWPENLLKGTLRGDGYVYVFLGKAGDRKPLRIGLHRLVCEAFHGPAPEGKTWTLHGNGVRNDNRAENLRWGSPKENNDDMLLHGTHPSQRPPSRRTGPRTAKNYCSVTCIRGHFKLGINRITSGSCKSCHRESVLSSRQKRGFDRNKADENYRELLDVMIVSSPL